MIDWIKAEWIAELRKPELSQGTGLLRDAEGNQCCLGVLCDVAVKHGIINPPYINGIDMHYNYDGCGAFPPVTVTGWAEMSSENPSVLYRGRETSLSHLNDNLRLTFSQIADLIEEYL